MAYGIEVLLGWTADKFASVKEELKVAVPTDEKEWHEAESVGLCDYLYSGDGIKPLNEVVREAQLGCLSAMTGKKTSRVGSGFRENVLVEGDEREFSVMGLQAYYDQSELGDERGDAVVGVPLAGRYAPIFLDWKGTWTGRAVLDARAIYEVAFLRRALASGYPFFSTADIICVLRHY